MTLWRSVSLVAAGLSAAMMSHAVAAGFDAVPRPYNPGNAPVHITAAWSSEADAPSDQVLTLAISEMVPFPPGASATAVVTPTEGLTLTHLGFDHKLGTHCTNGSPRWDVETTDGSSYAFGCAAGIHDIDLPAVGWERVTFSCSDVQVLKGLPGSCPLGTAQTVRVLQIVQDEAASTTLDNLGVNWAVIQSPAK
jgi:hypothetical protein